MSKIAYTIFHIDDKVNAVTLHPEIKRVFRQYLADVKAAFCFDWNQVEARYKTVEDLYPEQPLFANTVLYKNRMDLYKYEKGEIERKKKANTELNDLIGTANLIWTLCFPEASHIGNALIQARRLRSAAVETARLNIVNAGGNIDTIISNLELGIPPNAVFDPLFVLWRGAMEMASERLLWGHMLVILEQWCTPDGTTYQKLMERFNALSDRGLTWNAFLVEWNRVGEQCVSAGINFMPGQVDHRLADAISNPSLLKYVQDLKLDIDVFPRTHSVESTITRCGKHLRTYPAEELVPLEITSHRAFGAASTKPSKKPNAKKVLKVSKVNKASKLSNAKVDKLSKDLSRKVSFDADPPTKRRSPDDIAPRNLRLVGKEKTDTHCKRCDLLGHFTFQCRAKACGKCGAKLAELDFHDASTCK